jgi:uncharacterized protein
MTRDDADAGLDEFVRLGLTERRGGVRVPVRVRPRSSRSAILGVREGSLDVALTAPPVDGEANGELLRLLAKALGVRQADLSVAVGASGRSKLVDVNGVGAADARAMLARARR